MRCGRGGGRGGTIFNVFKYVYTKLESDFLTGEDEQFLESKIAVSSALFLASPWALHGHHEAKLPALLRATHAAAWWLGPSPPPHPPDVIHVMNFPRPSPFFSSFPLPRIIVNANGR